MATTEELIGRVSTQIEKMKARHALELAPLKKELATLRQRVRRDETTSEPVPEQSPGYRLPHRVQVMHNPKPNMPLLMGLVGYNGDEEALVHPDGSPLTKGYAFPCVDNAGNLLPPPAGEEHKYSAYAEACARLGYPAK